HRSPALPICGSGSLSHVDESNHPPKIAGPLRPTPELPAPVVSLWIPVIGGTALWLIAFVVLLLTGVHGVWLWTTLAGGGLGLVGDRKSVVEAEDEEGGADGRAAC